MQFERVRQSKKSEAAKQVGRGTVAAIRKVTVDTPLTIFENAFDTLTRGVITNVEVIQELKNYRERLPFVSVRFNQRYLAAALIAWNLLGMPSVKKMVKISGEKYRGVTESLLVVLLEMTGGKKVLREKTSEMAEDVVKPEITLFRYVMLICVELSSPIEGE